MKTARISTLLAVLLSAAQGLNADVRVATKVGEQPLEWKFSGRFRPGETFWGKNISLLNNVNEEDRIFYMRHTLDLNLNILYGLTACERTFAEVMVNVRNKGVWGNSTSIAQTTDTEFRILDSVGQSHKHFLPRHILWIREAWLRMDVGELFGFNPAQGHTFTAGAFSFILGRGIALGDAFAVSPDYLGFNADSAVDQYAFGLKLSGDIIKDTLHYDLYGAFLNNLASNLSLTAARILSQQYGKRENPVRGFGIVSFVFATRFFWIPIKTDTARLTFEPYLMYTNDPEQKVEIAADAETKLATFGIAGEYYSGSFEGGFDTAFNVGRQAVKGIDRNVILQQNRNGRLTFINSHVLVNVDPKGANVPSNLNPYKAPQSPMTIDGGVVSKAGSAVQGIINTSVQNENQNGAFIGNVLGYASAVGAPDPIMGNGANPNDLFNSCTRFRNPYENIFKGWMAVADIAWSFLDNDAKIAFAVGYASGDEDPNFVEKDGVYDGFIGLQGIYAGKRVRSAFVLGGAGKLQRPLTIPEEVNDTNFDDFAANTSDFTNLILVGSGFTWSPHDACNKWSLNPNILAYWRAHPDKKFDLKTASVTKENASRFYGTELNVFYDYEFIRNCKFFLVASAFIPGKYYEHIRGEPLTPAQQRVLDALVATGFDGNQAIPGIGTDTSYTLQLGFEIKF